MSGWRASLAWLLLAVFVATPAAAFGQKRNRISGQVVDKNNRPVPGVSVKIKRGAEVIDRQRTDKDGRYVLTFASGGPISTVLYECMDCYPCAISNVSGSKDHNITKVIAMKGEQLSAEEYREIKTTLEHLTGEPGADPAARQQYAEMIKLFPEPSAVPSYVAPAPRATPRDPVSIGLPFVAPEEVAFVGVLKDALTTERARRGDRFEVAVLGPSQYAGASIEGHVGTVKRDKNRAELTLIFDRLRTEDGRVFKFTGAIEEVIAGSNVRKSNLVGKTADATEDKMRISIKRSYTGALVGSIIGSVVSGQKGAAVGAAIGGEAGMTTVLSTQGGVVELGSGIQLKIMPARVGAELTEIAAAARSAPAEMAGAASPAAGRPDADSSLRKAHELYVRGRYVEALAEVRRLLAVEPSNAEAHHAAGVLQLYLGEQAAAINSLKTAVSLDRERKLIDARLLLSRLYLERGDREQALLYVQSALQLDPKNEDAHGLREQIMAGSRPATTGSRPE